MKQSQSYQGNCAELSWEDKYSRRFLKCQWMDQKICYQMSLDDSGIYHIIYLKHILMCSSMQAGPMAEQ